MSNYKDRRLRFTSLQIDELSIERVDLRRSGDAYIDTLNRKKRETEESETNRMTSAINDRRRSLDLANKKIKNIKVDISRYKDFFAEAVHTNYGLEDCTGGNN